MSIIGEFAEDNMYVECIGVLHHFQLTMKNSLLASGKQWDKMDYTIDFE